ncbi:MAG: hypothetical protein BWY82_02206 [Verrucomicrobia bacterium ADurb.Bin474]|nr:MAG: hypothetical protein BWY82_02206 [Verrucomicrobia bacterium ADurb.Bin474]
MRAESETRSVAFKPRLHLQGLTLLRNISGDNMSPSIIEAPLGYEFLSDFTVKPFRAFAERRCGSGKWPDLRAKRGIRRWNEKLHTLCKYCS